MPMKLLAAASFVALTTGLLVGGATAGPAGKQQRIVEKLPRPLGRDDRQLSPGLNVLDLVALDTAHTGPAHLPRIAITLPRGWRSHDGFAVLRFHGSSYLMGLSFWDVAQVYGTPCKWQSEGTVDPGRTVASLAAALGKQPLRDATAPKNVVLAGAHGKYLRFTVPQHLDFTHCDQGYFESWTGLGWSSDRYEQGPGQVDRLWVLNVEGQRLVVDADYLPTATEGDRAELNRIVHSIRFLPATARKTASARTGRYAADLNVAGAVVNDINDRGQIVGGLNLRGGPSRGFMWQNGSLTVIGRGPWVSANAINGRGQIIGTSSSAANPEQHAVTWRNGKMTDLGFTFVTAINDRDQILGARMVPATTGYTSEPVLWQNRQVTNLWPAVPGTAFDTNTGASAINNRGQIVGETTHGRAVLWQHGKITDLGPGGAVAINERGQVAGSSQTAAAGYHLFLWQNGTRTDLGPGMPVAINERGQIIGTRWTGGGMVHAFLWQNGTATDLGTLGGNWSYPTAISDRGQVVGYSTNERGVQHAFVWQNGTMTRLPSPVGDERTRAIAINNRNQIVGDNCYADCGLRSGPLSGSKFAVLWTLHGSKIDTVELVGRH